MYRLLKYTKSKSWTSRGLRILSPVQKTEVSSKTIYMIFILNSDRRYEKCFGFKNRFYISVTAFFLSVSNTQRKLLHLNLVGTFYSKRFYFRLPKVFLINLKNRQPVTVMPVLDKIIDTFKFLTYSISYNLPDIFPPSTLL